jgi:bifunctional ADP-heptose synthase (sugar kinase/adenylyltransferase)
MSIKDVYDVIVFDSDEELINTIKQNEPDYFIIGSDYKNKKIIGSDYAKNIIFFERTQQSTTEIINTWDTNNNLK